MFRLLPCLLASALLAAATSAASPLEGRWHLDKTRSTALDGWHEWDLVVQVSGSQVSLKHEMKWGRTEFTATNVIDTAQAASLANFFRVEQRHMALYPAKGGVTPVRAGWLDEGRTLRVEADAPIEISQGQTTMRIYAEYRVLEGGRDLLLIELHSSRPKPLVYHFTRVTEVSK
jgi:hypothetical protein